MAIMQDSVRSVEDAHRQMASGGCFLPFVVVVLLAVGCGSPKGVQTSEKIVYRDRVEYVQTPADTSAMEALLRCSEEGEVLIAALTEEAAKGARMQTQIDSLGRLRVKVIRVHDSVPVEVHDTVVVREAQQTRIVEVEKPLAWWQRLTQVVGTTAIAVGICLLIGYIVIRRK